MTTKDQSKPSPFRGYNTNQAAAAFGVVPHTLRVSLYLNGHYLGIHPTKLPNKRLVWPADEVDHLARGVSRASDPLSSATP